MTVFLSRPAAFPPDPRVSEGIVSVGSGTDIDALQALKYPIVQGP